MKKKRGERSTGANRMTQLGWKPVQIWLDPAELNELKKIAAADMRPVTVLIKLAVKELLLRERSKLH